MGGGFGKNKLEILAHRKKLERARTVFVIQCQYGAPFYSWKKKYDTRGEAGLKVTLLDTRSKEFKAVSEGRKTGYFV